MKLGAIPSPKDERDYSLARCNAVKIEKTVEEHLPAIQMTQKNQGAVGKCVASGKSSTREDKQFKQSGKIVIYSEDFLYANRAPDDYQGAGMYPRQALKSLQKFGIVPKNYFTYPGKEYEELSTLLTPRLASLLGIALPNRISAYYRTYDTRERELSILNLGSQTFTFPIYESFFKTGSDGIIPEPAGDLVGFHEMVAFGWNRKNYWVGQNSWGSGWGHKGKYYYRKDYPIQESWAEEDYVYPESEGDDLTQEQFNRMLENYFEMVAAKQPSEWSAIERTWMESMGYIQGDANGRKRYKNFVTREELSAILYRIFHK